MTDKKVEKDFSIDTSTITPVKKRFHNIDLNVYPTTLPLSEIKFWKENNRTLFSFEVLQRRKNKPLEKLSIEEITEFVASQKIHKLSALAESIKRNGVQIPLIIRDDGKLLDGNRRFFASHWLRITSNESLDVLSNIPVQVIRNSDLHGDIELKILAEANFIQDLKEPWPLDAQARAVDDFIKTQVSTGLDREAAMVEASNVFGISKSRVRDLIDSLKLSLEFINESKDKDEINRRRAIVEERFVYFWEFKNKALSGRSKYTNNDEIKEIKGMFFSLMDMGLSSPIKNVKQVEPLAQARKNKTAWAMLKEDSSRNFSLAINTVNEKKEIRKAEDKIRLFINWLEDMNVTELSPAAIQHLDELKNLINSMSTDA